MKKATLPFAPAPTSSSRRSENRGATSACTVDARIAIGRDRERGEARLRRALEHDHLLLGLDHAVRIVGRARRAHAKLSMPEHALQRDRDVRVGDVAAILDRDRVHGAGEIGVAPVRREERPAHDESVHDAREGRNPSERALPRELQRGELARHAIDRERRAAAAACRSPRGSPPSPRTRAPRAPRGAARRARAASRPQDGRRGARASDCRSPARASRGSVSVSRRIIGEGARAGVPAPSNIIVSLPTGNVRDRASFRSARIG